MDLRIGRKNQLDLVELLGYWECGGREGGMGSVKNLASCFETG